MKNEQPIPCHYKGCKEDLRNLDSGNFYSYFYGGYGDFKDTAFETDKEATAIDLCHKHAHKVFNKIYGYGRYGSTSHHGKEVGFWVGHHRWETKNIITLLVVLFRNPKIFMREIQELKYLVNHYGERSSWWKELTKWK